MVLFQVMKVDIMQLEVVDDDKFDWGKFYLVFLDELFVNKVKIYFDFKGEDVGIVMVNKVILDCFFFYYELIDDGFVVNYWVKVIDNMLWLMMFGED